MSHANMLEADLAVLVVIDVQEKLFPGIGSAPTESILANMHRLIETARLLSIPILHTEQYPRGLGPTIEPLRAALGADAAPLVKTTCSCWRDEAFRRALQRTEREHVILAGIETHVCVQQTALDLLRVDYVPFVPEDAVGSRRLSDAASALARMARAGAETSTTEALIFELIERCDHPRFREFLKLVKA